VSNIIIFSDRHLQRRGERRRWARVVLVDEMHAVIRSGERIEKLLDLSYAGCAIETAVPDLFPAVFVVELWLPLLPMRTARLHPVYRKPQSNGKTRIGCSFVT
jgi:hypothetical protein